MTRKCVDVNDLSSGQYSVNKNIRFKNSVLRSDLCDFSYAYFVVKGKKLLMEIMIIKQEINS